MPRHPSVVHPPLKTQNEEFVENNQEGQPAKRINGQWITELPERSDEEGSTDGEDDRAAEREAAMLRVARLLRTLLQLLEGCNCAITDFAASDNDHSTIESDKSRKHGVPSLADSGEATLEETFNTWRIQLCGVDALQGLGLGVNWSL